MIHKEVDYKVHRFHFILGFKVTDIFACFFVDYGSAFNSNCEAKS